MIDWKFDFVFMVVDITQHVAFHPMGRTTYLIALVVTTEIAIKPIPLVTLFLLPYGEELHQSNVHSTTHFTKPPCSIGIQYVTKSSPKQHSMSTTNSMLCNTKWAYVARK